MGISSAGAQAGNAWFVGTGSPEGVVTAGVGTVYVRTDGSAGSAVFVKETGSAATGWAPLGSRTTAGFEVDAFGSPAAYRANMGRLDASVDLAALTTQVMTSVAIPLVEGDVVTNLTFVSGGTPAGTPTNWWFALYSTAATPALIAQSADQTTTAWAANTSKALALSAPYTVTTTGIHYAACMVKATTVPTLVGIATQNAVISGALATNQPVLARTSGAALTTTAPGTIATPTTSANVPLVIVT